MRKEPHSQMRKNSEVAVMALQIGFSVSITTVVFVAGGKWLDQYFGYEPRLTIIGMILGLAGSLGLVWRIVSKSESRW